MGTDTRDYKSAGVFSIDRQRQTSVLDLSERHYHDCYEIYFLESGERRYFIRDTPYQIYPGTLALIDMYCIHKVIEVKDKLEVRRILIKFKPAFFGNLLSSLNQSNLFAPFTSRKPVLRLNDDNQRFVSMLLQTMLNEYEDRQPGYEDVMRNFLATLLIQISRGIIPDQAADSLRTNDPLNEKILSVVDHLNSEFPTSVTLDSLSERFSMSRWYLCRSFKKVIGIGVVDYLNNIRISNAQRLLRQTVLPVHRVAEEVGYRTEAHFERVFKTLNGTSPAKYRKAALPARS